MYPNITIKIQVQKHKGKAQSFMELENFEVPVIGSAAGKRLVLQQDVEKMTTQIHDIVKLLGTPIGNMQSKALLTFKNKEAHVCRLRLDKNDFSNRGSVVKGNVLKKLENTRWQRFNGLKYLQKPMERAAKLN